MKQLQGKVSALESKLELILSKLSLETASITNVTATAVSEIPTKDVPDTIRGKVGSGMVKSKTRKISDRERKLNIVVFGIPECQAGASKVLRLREDFNSVTKVIKECDDSLSLQKFVRDCFRLGKYSKFATL